MRGLTIHAAVVDFVVCDSYGCDDDVRTDVAFATVIRRHGVDSTSRASYTETVPDVLIYQGLSGKGLVSTGLLIRWSQVRILPGALDSSPRLTR